MRSCILRRTSGTKYWAVGTTPYLSNRWMRQVASTGTACLHSGRSPAGTPGPGSQATKRARSIHHFDITYLTPTDGLQDAVGLESWGSLDSKALIKLEKTREESKSSAAGERKELILKIRSLSWQIGQFGFFGHAHSWE